MSSFSPSRWGAGQACSGGLISFRPWSSLAQEEALSAVLPHAQPEASPLLSAVPGGHSLSTITADPDWPSGDSHCSDFSGVCGCHWIEATHVTWHNRYPSRGQVREPCQKQEGSYLVPPGSQALLNSLHFQKEVYSKKGFNSTVGYNMSLWPSCSTLLFPESRLDGQCGPWTSNIGYQLRVW